MPQSLSQIYIHLVFHVRYDGITVKEQDLPRLYAYLDGIIANKHSLVIQIGGTQDHVHILCTLPRTISVSDFVEDIKKCSSKWLKTVSPDYGKFAWQGGYGVFSVSVSQLDNTRKYICSQKEHHQNKSFQEEYEAFLKAYNVKYDPQYVFSD